MDLSRDVPLAGARFPLQQDRGVGIPGGQFDEVGDRRGHPRRGCLGASAGPEHGDLLSEARAFGGTGDGGRQSFEIDRLFQQVGGAVLHGRDGGSHVGVSGEHDDGEVGVVRPKRLERPEAVGIGEAQIEEHDIRSMLGGHPPSFGGGGRSTRGEAEGLEKFDQR